MADLVQGPRIDVHFPGGKRVTADFNGFSVPSDQPVKAGGEGSAPSPFDLFFASLATCAGYYVLEFCRGRDIPLDGVRLSQVFDRDVASKRVVAVHLLITVPASFPEKYRNAVMQAAASCTVKKLVENPPAMDIQVAVG
ncbi:MAG: OsmC family protein [Planctomycetes bacterium]|nr:OsmC family protein [Planctomycetota bacterium]MCC7397655.1 OsmC family protein [Planctomycetota bacterium]